MELTVTIEAMSRAVAILCRVSGVVVLAPLLSSRSLPGPVRLIVLLGLTVAMLSAAPPAAAARTGVDIIAAIPSELMLGIGLGLIAELLFASVDISASSLSFGVGMSYVNQIDPTSPVRGTALMTVQWMFASLLFLVFDGHHLVLRALATSFEVVPPGAARIGGLGEAMLVASSSLFSFGLALAAPALVVLMLVDLSLGLVGRVAPHTHALIIGMGLKPLAGFAALSLAYAALPNVLGRALERMAENFGRLIQAAVG